MISAVDRARQLRRRSTEAEKALWRRLRARQLDGMKFRRQHPIGRFVVDFVCIENKLVVELDGGQHARQRVQDDARTNWLEDQGFRVLRFWNNEVFENPEGVLMTIQRALDCRD